MSYVASCIPLGGRLSICPVCTVTVSSAGTICGTAKVCTSPSLMVYDILSATVLSGLYWLVPPLRRRTISSTLSGMLQVASTGLTKASTSKSYGSDENSNAPGHGVVALRTVS